MRLVSLIGRLCVAVVVLHSGGLLHARARRDDAARPAPALSVLLNDEGRMQTAQQVGPSAVRIDGELVQATESNYVLAVRDVVDIRGTHSKWTGETVPLPRSYVMTTYERRFSTPKTVLLLGTVAAGFMALVASFNLFGFGGSSGDGGQPPDPNDQ
jgi:hypothetical protein